MLKFLSPRLSKYRAIFRTWFESFLAFEIGIHAKDLIKKDVIIPAAVAADFGAVALHRWHLRGQGGLQLPSEQVVIYEHLQYHR